MKEEISLQELSKISGLPSELIQEELGLSQNVISIEDLKLKLVAMVESTLPLIDE
jgi:hypothetical protein